MKRKIKLLSLFFVLFLSLAQGIKADFVKDNPLSNIKEPDYPLETKPIEPKIAKRSICLPEQEIVEINGLADFVAFAKNSQNNCSKQINLNTDINLSGVSDVYQIVIKKDVVFNGNYHKITNYTNTSKYLFSYNQGVIKNITFDHFNMSRDVYANIIARNYNIIENMGVTNSTFRSTNEYAGAIGRNYGKIKGSILNNITVITGSYGAALVSLSTTDYNQHDVGREISNQTPIIENTSLTKIVVKSNPYYNQKTYRNSNFKDSISGDYLGSVVGKNVNARIYNTQLKTSSIYGDDYLGGIAGVNCANNNNETAIIEKANISNLGVYGGGRLGGVAGYNYSSQALSTSRINYKTTAHNSINAVIKNTNLSGSLLITGYTELGGIIGLNYSAKAVNNTVNVIRQNYNIYSFYDEAAGLIADNEFGYVADSKTNANSYAKVFQAAGAISDNEGTILRVSASGNIKTPKEVGGLVGSNLGTVVSSKASGNIYSTTKIKHYLNVKKIKRVKRYIKVQVTKKAKKSCRDTKTKKCKRVYVTKKVCKKVYGKRKCTKKYVYYKKKKVKYYNQYVKKKVCKKVRGYRKKRCVKKQVYYKKVVYYPVYSGNFVAYNGNVKYKGFNLKGKVYSSSYTSKRYLNSKLMSNRAFGAYGK